MDKIKFFSYDTKNDKKEDIENKINEFIKDKKVKDIKFSTDIATLTENFTNIQIMMITIMIIYEENS